MKFNSSLISSLVLLIALLSCTSHEKDTLPVEKRLEILGKVWGYLKYHHPNVSAGNTNWDSVLLSQIPKVIEPDSISVLNKVLDQLNESAGSLIDCGDRITSMPDTLESMVDFNWLNELASVNKSLSDDLKRLYLKCDERLNKYVEVTSTVKFNEVNPEVKDLDDATTLLVLFKHWNAIQYFYPYKDIIDADWDQVLLNHIPKFRNISNRTELLWAIRELNSLLDDGHTRVQARFDDRSGVNFQVPFRVDWINDKTIIAEVPSDSSLSEIEVGDEVVSKNGIPIQELRDSLSRYFRESHELKTNLVLNGFILMTDTNYLDLGIIRNGKEMDVRLPCHDIRTGSWFQPFKRIATSKNLPESVGYIDANKLEINEVDATMEEFEETSALIIDLRKYPRQFGAIDTLINKYLSPRKTQFCLIKYPNPQIPGTYYYSNTNYIGPSKPNQDSYKGQIIVLVSERTGSQGEFSTMKLQAIPNVYTIGRRTSGADGNISYITLPGGIRSFHSGIGIYYPDSTNTQRVGVNIDLTVERTMEEVLGGKDEIFEAALSYLRKTE